MSLTSMFKDLSPTKALGYSLVGGGSAMSLFNGSRLISGDITASTGLMEGFAAIATGLPLLTQEEKPVAALVRA